MYRSLLTCILLYRFPCMAVSGSIVSSCILVMYRLRFPLFDTLVNVRPASDEIQTFAAAKALHVLGMPRHCTGFIHS